MKGTDQAGSLEANGLWKMTRDIRNTELALGKEGIFAPKTPKATINKLRRSLAVNKNIKKGAVLKANDLMMLSPGNGLRWSDRTKILNKKAKVDIKTNSLLTLQMFK